MKKLTFILLCIMVLSGCSEKVLRVACVGDSITEGAGLQVQSKTSYPVMLDSLLGPKYSVLNCGRSATTLQKQGDFPYWISKEFSNTFTYRPDIIIVKLGTNDTKSQNWQADRFKHDYQSLIDTLKTIPGQPKIYLCLPVPVYKTEWGINDSTLVKGVIPIIKELAQHNKLTLIDLYQGMSGQPENFPDNIHPNEQGAKKMAKIIADKIIGN
ncbi:MAG: GDSL-type esterase/lipase family protein [Paludibacter sp.]|nr:GDSL-type esterase/lipase family protein [Paludibacter sp.]